MLYASIGLPNTLALIRQLYWKSFESIPSTFFNSVPLFLSLREVTDVYYDWLSDNRVWHTLLFAKQSHTFAKQITTEEAQESRFLYVFFEQFRLFL